MVLKLRVAGLVYSVLSALLLPALLFMQVMSIFLFDAPGSTGLWLPYVLALGIFLIPVILVAANIFMWFAIRGSDDRSAIFYMVLPVAYTVLFFVAWALVDSFY